MSDPKPWTQEDIDHDMGVEEVCGNCGGEGVTYDCIDGCCLYADEGCELCERRCDWCQGKG